MRPQTSIQRHGYHLMSLASLGLFAVVLLGMFLATMPWMSSGHPRWAGWNIAGVQLLQATEMMVPGKRLLSVAALLWTLACMAPLIALRRLGHRLYRHDGLSRTVADAFRWLAHSLLLYGLCNIMAGALATFAVEYGGGADAGIAFSFSGVYVYLIACLCLYSVAHLMRLASEAADDARSIV